jgi:hypothetical protein
MTMAREFTMKVRMTNAAMLEPKDLHGPLRDLADKLRHTEIRPSQTVVGLIWDANGNSVGTWTISDEED